MIAVGIMMRHTAAMIMSMLAVQGFCGEGLDVSDVDGMTVEGCMLGFDVPDLSTDGIFTEKSVNALPSPSKTPLLCSK